MAGEEASRSAVKSALRLLEPLDGGRGSIQREGLEGGQALG